MLRMERMIGQKLCYKNVLGKLCEGGSEHIFKLIQSIVARFSHSSVFRSSWFPLPPPLSRFSFLSLSFALIISLSLLPSLSLSDPPSLSHMLSLGRFSEVFTNLPKIPRNLPKIALEAPSEDEMENKLTVIIANWFPLVINHAFECVSAQSNGSPSNAYKMQ